MYSDYVDDWDAIPSGLREALTPAIDQLDSAADALFDRRLNLSFEAAVKEISIPGVIDLTSGMRLLAAAIQERIAVSADGLELAFDASIPITSYDLPIYTPCLYISQLSQHLLEQNVRVWKSETLIELILIETILSRYVRPDIETARVVAAAIYDLTALDRDNIAILREQANHAQDVYPNEASILERVMTLMGR